MKLNIMIMSGLDDGLRLSYSDENEDGIWGEGKTIWKISIGRREDSDLCLLNDTFVSRLHAHIVWEQDQWWLEDCESTNGTFIENTDTDLRVSGTIPVQAGQLFRIGHTWMRIEEEVE